MGAPGRSHVVGGSPRGARPDVSAGDPETEADRLADAAVRDPSLAPLWAQGWEGWGGEVPEPLRIALEPLMGGPLGGARVDADARAADSAASVGAAAYAYGDRVAMGRGRFRPGSPEGRRLLAHELAHVARQGREGRATLQRQEVEEMPPMVVRSGLGEVESAVGDLDRLRGVAGPEEVPGLTLERDPATVAAQAAPAARRLPFTASGGWDASAILDVLAQRDTLAGTDSDAVRCVQAVALASRVVDGPEAVVGFLRAMSLEAMMGRPPTSRQQTALRVLEHVRLRIEAATATFADLLWAMEALHDVFYSDTEGTPTGEILDRLGPTFDFSRIVEPRDEWLDSPADVIARVQALAPGEQLLVTTHTVVFNVAFDDLSEQGIEVRTGRSIVVQADGRNRRIRRIATDTRPPHTAIDPIVRDRDSGHQLLVFRDSATGDLRLYEPETTQSGHHLENLAADGSNFERYFQDQPGFGIYHYIQIIGRVTPMSLTSSSAWDLP